MVLHRAAPRGRHLGEQTRRERFDAGRPPDPAASSPGASAVRTRFVLNGTTEDDTIALAPYARCLVAHGVRVDSTNNIDKQASTDGLKVEAARKVCAPYYPLPPIEYDAKNPQAIDFNRAVARCLRGKGVRYVDVVVSGGQVNLEFGGSHNDAQSIALGSRYLEACQTAESKAEHR